MKTFIRLIFITTTMLSAVSCMRPIKQDQIQFSGHDLESINSECELIKNEGSILDLIKVIKMNHKKVMTLLERNDPSLEIDKIKELALSSKESGEKIRSLIRSDWSKGKWNQEISWSIHKSDFSPTTGAHIPQGFKMLDAEIDSIYFMGEEREDLRGQISFELVNGVVRVKFSTLASSLDVCELQRSLVIVTAIKFRSLNSIYKQWFNLNVKNEE
jgi:hypothetical protein